MNTRVIGRFAAVVASMLVADVARAELERVVFLEAHPDDLASEMGTAVLMKGVYEMHVIDYTHGEWGCGEEKATKVGKLWGENVEVTSAGGRATFTLRPWQSVMVEVK